MEEKIDINLADVETLASLPGIGQAKATKIVEYRTDVHSFEEIIELAAVPGISERMVRQIADLIVVNETADVETNDVERSGQSAEALDRQAVNSENETEPLDEPEEAVQLAEETNEPTEQVVEDALETREAMQEEPPVVVMLDEQPQPEPTSPPEPAAAPEQTNQPQTPEIIERRVVERAPGKHWHWGQQILGVIVGAVLGAFFTLLLLFLLNGTLRFADDSRTTDLQLQLDDETSAIRQSQSSMADEMGALTGRVAELENDLAASGEAIDAVGGDVADLQDETAALYERLEAIDLSAEKFDTFLTGLRDLLVTLQGPAPTPTSTTTISGTATITTTLTPEGTAVSPTSTPTPTSQTPDGGEPTRTPRPTATPIIE